MSLSLGMAGYAFGAALLLVIVLVVARLFSRRHKPQRDMVHVEPFPIDWEDGAP